jgi:hypothetical protein
MDAVVANKAIKADKPIASALDATAKHMGN